MCMLRRTCSLRAYQFFHHATKLHLFGMLLDSRGQGNQMMAGGSMRRCRRRQVELLSVAMRCAVERLRGTFQPSTPSSMINRPWRYVASELCSKRRQKNNFGCKGQYLLAQKRLGSKGQRLLVRKRLGNKGQRLPVRAHH
mmetsp:Transcript_90816/g.166340  ORF Transcript_90816/g.166340 Transcript_90816/m.166340 type:complete len:140 (+) Transcript_90816:156-575(+)